MQFGVVAWVILALMAACAAPAPPSAGGGQAEAPAGQEAAPAEAPPAEILIGAIYPLSGPQAQTGNDIKAAVELAAEIINGEYPDLLFPLAASAGLPNLGGAKVKTNAWNSPA